MPIARFQMPDGRIGRFEVPDGTTPEQAQSLIGKNLSSVMPKASQLPSESQYWHDAGKSPNANFPNVKEEGGILPIETTYNPDMTVDSSRVDWKAPFRNLATGVGDLYQQAENKSTDTTPAAVNAMLAMSGAPAAARGIASAGESIIPSVVKSIKGEPKPIYDPIATHSAISDAYGKAKEATKPYYNLMRDIGSGETADATKLKPALDSMISDIKNTPFHEATSELSYLKQQAAKIGDDGRIPLNDMVQLKQNLNSNFNPKRFSEGSDTPYATVGGLVDDSLDDAAKRIPEFGEAKTLADKNWLNTVKSPFEDNTVLKKIWKPEDFYAKKSVDSGMLEQLPDPTQQRASGMLKNIKTPVELNAVRRVLPQDLSDTLSQAKIDDVIQKEGAGRLASAGKAVMGLPKIAVSPLKGTGEVLTNAGRAFVPDLSPEGKALINAAKAPPPALSTKYQQPFSALKSSVQQQEDLANEMQPFGVFNREPLAAPILRGTESDYVNPNAGGLGDFSSNTDAPSMGAERMIAPMGGAETYINPQAKGLGRFLPNTEAPVMNIGKSGEPVGGVETYANPVAKGLGKAISNEESDRILRELEKQKPGNASDFFVPEGYKKGGSARKNLTAQFLATRKRA